MANSVAEAVIGAVVLATAAGFVLYAGQSRGVQVGGDSYPLHASFRSAEGITVGTDVRLAGINVGSVTGLELDPASFEARTTFTVRRRPAAPGRLRRQDRLREPARRQLRRDHPRRLGGHARERRRDREHAGLGQPAQPAHALRDRAMTAGVLGIALALAAGQAVAAQSAQVGRRRRPRSRRASCTCAGSTTSTAPPRTSTCAVGETTRFGHLEITAEACRVPRDDPDGRRLRVPEDPRHPRGDAALLRLDVRLVAGALGARPPALRRLGAELQQPTDGSASRRAAPGSRPAGASAASSCAVIGGAADLDRAEAAPGASVTNWVSSRRKPPARSRATSAISANFEASRRRLNMLSPKKAPPSATP